MQPLLAVSFGGGVNSTAMLCGMAERGIRPDAVTFSDTGGEKPATYAHIGQMQCWLSDRGWPPITILRYHAARTGDLTLEAELLRRNALPALAYGFHTCSLKWKRDPFLMWWRKLGKPALRSAIGFDAGEPWRSKNKSQEAEITNWYPLVEWGWAREECIAAIERAGLPVPPKSSCFFCPAMKKAEVSDLQRNHPDLLARALEIERRATEAGNTGDGARGLNRSWRWDEYLKSEGRGLFRDAEPMPCMCADGSDSD